MKQRGRKSTASLTVLPTVLKPVETDAPEHLSDQEKAEWKKIVDRMPTGFFTAEMFPMLAALCQHIVSQKKISAIIDGMGQMSATDPEAIKQYDRLLAMRERESRAMASFSTKLRLTPQSRYQPNTAGSKTAGVGSGAIKPWEFGKAV